MWGVRFFCVLILFFSTNCSETYEYSAPVSMSTLVIFPDSLHLSNSGKYLLVGISTSEGTLRVAKLGTVMIEASSDSVMTGI